MKTVAVYTLGCKVNQVESEEIKERFMDRGYRIVGFEQPADVYIVNTCSVTHVSDRKSRAMIRRTVRRHPGAAVVVTGCLAQLDGQELAGMEGVALVVGNQDKHRIVDLVDELREVHLNEPAPVICSPPGRYKLEPVIYSESHERTRAFVKVQDGCQSHCSYCIVPQARGPLRSKDPGDVIREIRQLLALHYREIVLTGIHTGHYGVDLDGWDFTRLLMYILEHVAGDYRIRLSSLEPLEIKPELRRLMREEKRLCRHFHVPLQSGSDRILRRMNRQYGSAYYRGLMEDIAGEIAQVALTADVMVGFPGEEEGDFKQTFDLLAGLPLLDLHVFKYSRRPGTEAALMSGQVTAYDAEKRSGALIELGRLKHDAFVDRMRGQELRVLVEKQTGDREYLGLSDNYVEVRFSSELDRVGQMLPVKITGKEGRAARGNIAANL